jgi:peptide/nickel transport system permease protein
MSLKQEEFVTASVSIGAKSIRIICKHILPNTIASILVIASFNLAHVIMIEASLSFLGLGVQPPNPSWGAMISDSREYIYTAWWQVTFPGIALMVLVLAVNQLGDGLRDLLDPRLKGVL